jgi:hypothetical protein
MTEQVTLSREALDRYEVLLVSQAVHGISNHVGPLRPTTPLSFSNRIEIRMA